MARATSDRRGFLARVGGWTLGGLALWLAPGCDSGTTGGEDDDLGMHGPVEVDHEVLKLPAAAGALALFAPYDDGTPFLRRWSVAHVAREWRDQLVVVAVDLETGGHAQLELWGRDPGMRPIAHSERYGVYLNNGGQGSEPTPRHIRLLAERLAGIVARNEDRVILDSPVPRLRDAPPDAPREALQPADPPGPIAAPAASMTELAAP